MTLFNYSFSRWKFLLKLRFWFVISIFMSCLFFVFFQGGKLASTLFFVICAIFIYLVLGYWSGVRHVKVERSFFKAGQVGEIEAGQKITVELNVIIPGIYPVPYVYIQDQLQRHNGEVYSYEDVILLDLRKKVSLTYKTHSLKRGYYRFLHTDCATEDMIGLFKHQGQCKNIQTITVIPQTVEIQHWLHLHQSLKHWRDQLTSQHAHRESTQINGIREYIYGDRLSRIHWNATAKTGVLKSKEFERETLTKMMIWFDRQKSAYADDSQFELAVSTVASLIRYGSKHRISLGLLSVGHEATLMESSPNHNRFQEMFSHLTSVEPDGQDSLTQVMSHYIDLKYKGYIYVIITPQTSAEWMPIIQSFEARQMLSSVIQIQATVQSELTRDSYFHYKNSFSFRRSKMYSISKLEDLSGVLGGA
jgi:uncharacterized protein (DUF58 family)